MAFLEHHRVSGCPRRRSGESVLANCKQGTFSKSDVSAQGSDYLGRIVNERNFDRIKGMLDKTKGNIVFGGQKFDRKDKFIELTIVTDVTRNDSVMQEEIFGPILPIITVSGIDEAIDVINGGDKPLSLYIFSTDKAVHDEIIARQSDQI